MLGEVFGEAGGAANGSVGRVLEDDGRLARRSVCGEGELNAAANRATATAVVSAGGVASLALAIARQLSEQKNLGPFAAYQAYEGYANPQQADKKPVANYTLLADEFAPAAAPGMLTAKTCYEADFEAATEKTGNYIQRTNNFKHGIPDSCSSQRTEMVNSFYKSVSL